MKRLSIIISTYKHKNRFSGLRKNILSLSTRENNNLIFEIIIVDNGNSILEYEKTELLKYNSKVIFVIENKIGLSVARNTGIKNSKGDIIAFIDDDIWAKNILEIYKNEDILCAGGEVKMTNMEVLRKKKWVSDYFLRFLFPTNFPKETGKIIAPYFLIGANMSFRKETFEKYDLFDEQLGRIGKKLLSCEDTEFIGRLPKEKIFFIKNTEVFGEIEEKRLTRVYMLKRLFWQGYSDYIFIKKVGIDRFFDKKEIIFNISFFNFCLSKLQRLKFFEFIGILARITGFYISKNKIESR